MGNISNTGVCNLCNKTTNLCESHIIPKFFWKEITKTSVGVDHCRNYKNINKKEQDLPKEFYFCDNCEQKMSIYENYYRKNYFNTFKSGKGIIVCEDALIKFLTIVFFRILVDLKLTNSYVNDVCLDDIISYWKSTIINDKVDNKHKFYVTYLNEQKQDNIIKEIILLNLINLDLNKLPKDFELATIQIKHNFEFIINNEIGCDLIIDNLTGDIIVYFNIKNLFFYCNLTNRNLINKDAELIINSKINIENCEILDSLWFNTIIDTVKNGVEKHKELTPENEVRHLQRLGKDFKKTEDYARIVKYKRLLKSKGYTSKDNCNLRKLCGYK